MAGLSEGDADPAPHSFLVGLGAPERDDQPLPNALDVVAIEAHDFRSPEPAREAAEQQRAVSRVLHALAIKSRTRNRFSSKSGLASRRATPCARLTPRNVARTICERQGFGSPLVSCASEVVAMRRTSVATLRVSGCAAR
jgi:hypothetical protein